MAVAALSTSAIALAAGPAPASTGAAPAPETFAKLVDRATPDERHARDGASPEGSARGKDEGDAALTSDEPARAAPESDPAAFETASPADLLARLDAMLAAAGQIGIGAPATAVPAPTIATIATATPEPVTTIAAAPAPAAPATAPASIGMAAPSPPGPAGQAPLPVPSVEMPAPISVSMPRTETAQPSVTPDLSMAAKTTQAPAVAETVVRPAILQKGSDIAQLLASLRSAFAGVEGKNAPVPAAVPPAVAPAGATIPQPAIPATPTTPAMVLAEASAPTPPTPVVAASIATAAVPPLAQDAPEPTAAPVVTDIVATENLRNAIAETPMVAEAAPSIATAEVIVPPTDIGAINDEPEAALPETPPTAESADIPDATIAATTESITPLPAAAPGQTVPLATDPTEAVALAEAPVDEAVTRELDLARDHQWLDRLARDISQAATRDGQIRFRLNPEHLGALTVEIANSAAGTAIRMTAETDQARAIIAEAQPRLLAEVRAQGLRVADAQVDSNQQGSSSGSASAQGQQQQQNRQPSEDSKPFMRTQTANRDDAADSAPADDGELYA